MILCAIYSISKVLESDIQFKQIIQMYKKLPHSNTQVRFVIYDSIKILFNPFNPSQLLTPNFSLHNTYKIRQLVMKTWGLIKQSKLLKIKSKVL